MIGVAEKPAAPLISAFLESSSDDIAPQEKAWLQERLDETIAWTGEEPNEGSMQHFLKAFRSLTEHDLAQGKIRVIVIHERGGRAMKLANLVVVFDQGGQEANMRAAYELARATE